MTVRLLAVLATSVAVPTALLAAAEVPNEAESAPALTLADLWTQGGWAMWPLLACSTAALLLIAQGLVDTRAGRCIGPRAESLSGPREGTWLGDCVASATRANPGTREALEAGFFEALDVTEARVSRRILYLNVIASVAPMIGLLGTVSGMIGAFQTIGRGGMGRPELLAGDIGEAMITTAAGLIVAIPAMVAYFGLRHRLAARVAVIEERGLRWLRASGTGGAGC